MAFYKQRSRATSGDGRIQDRFHHLVEDATEAARTNGAGFSFDPAGRQLYVGDVRLTIKGNRVSEAMQLVSRLNNLTASGYPASVFDTHQLFDMLDLHSTGNIDPASA